MTLIFIIAALLTGWAIRRISADFLAIRKTIRRRRAARKYDRLHRDESWRQILAIK